MDQFSQPVKFSAELQNMLFCHRNKASHRMLVFPRKIPISGNTLQNKYMYFIASNLSFPLPRFVFSNDRWSVTKYI